MQGDWSLLLSIFVLLPLAHALMSRHLGCRWMIGRGARTDFAAFLNDRHDRLVNGCSRKPDLGLGAVFPLDVCKASWDQQEYIPCNSL